MFGRWSMGTQVSSLLEATSQWWETARPAVQVPEYLQQTAPGEWIQSLLNHNNNEQQPQANSVGHPGGHPGAPMSNDNSPHR